MKVNAACCPRVAVDVVRNSAVYYYSPVLTRAVLYRQVVSCVDTFDRFLSMGVRKSDVKIFFNKKKAYAG